MEQNKTKFKFVFTS